MIVRLGSYWHRRGQFERRYWGQLARHPKATSFRTAARLAGVTASMVVRKFQQYQLRLKYGRR